VVSITPQPLYTWERTPVPTEQETRWSPRVKPGWFGFDKNLFPLPGLKSYNRQPSYYTISFDTISL